MKKLGFTIFFASLALTGWYGWKEYEVKKAIESSVLEVAPLVQYRELYAKGRDREANDVLLRVVATLVEADGSVQNISHFFISGLLGFGSLLVVSRIFRTFLLVAC
jgi:hypothetical protein